MPNTDPPAGPAWGQVLGSEDDLSFWSITRLTAQWQPPMQSPFGDRDLSQVDYVYL